jgi:N-acetylmuramoyl-L-alanine amidase
MKKIGHLLALLAVVLCLSASAAWARPTVVIDAGHGGHDRGGVPGDRYAEKIYTLDVSRRLEGRLRSMGYRTVMTRRGDYFVPLNDRCSIANSQGNAIFVSIHFNSAPREGANGIETYYYSRRSGSLASAVHRSVVHAVRTEDRRVRSRGFYVIRNTRVPAILVECGFLTNRSEGRLIAGSGAYRQRLADAIARGIRSRY